MHESSASKSRERQTLYSAYRQGGLAPTNDAGEAARLFVRQYLRGALRGHEGDVILELGAGSGWTLAALNGTGFAHCRGVDITPDQIAFARSNGIDVEERDAMSALDATAEHSLGGVVALDLFEHFQKQELIECVQRIRSRLRDGGVLALRVPNGAGIFGGSMRYGDLTHELAFTESSVRQLLSAAGFSHVDVRPCRPLVHGAVSAARYALWRAIEVAASVAVAAESGRWRGGIFTSNLFAVARR